jgi:hypothetical protein
VQSGGNATVSGGSLVLYSGNIAVSPSTILALNPQCSLPYTTVSDAWRASTNAQGTHGDCASGGTGLGGGGWYRFEGAGGDALPLFTPGDDHCGTQHAGWLSGWDASGVLGAQPPITYTTAGRYPTAAEGVVEMTVCFHQNSAPCDYHRGVEVLRCGDFLLWRLPYTSSSTGCNQGYCTTSSGL